MEKKAVEEETSSSLEDFLFEIFSKKPENIESIELEPLKKKEYLDDSSYYINKILTTNGDSNDKFLHYELGKNDLVNTENQYECIVLSKDNLFYELSNNGSKTRAIDTLVTFETNKKYLKNIYNFTKFMNKLEKNSEYYPDTDIYEKIKSIKDLAFVDDLLINTLKIEAKNGFFNPEGIYNLFYFSRNKILNISDYRTLFKLETSENSKTNNPGKDLALASYYSLYLNSSFLRDYFSKDGKILDFDGSSFGVLMNKDDREELDFLEIKIEDFLLRIKSSLFNRVYENYRIPISKHQVKEFEKFLLFLNNVTTYHIDNALQKISNKDSKFLKMIENKFGKNGLLEYLIQTHNTIQNICLYNYAGKFYDLGFYFDGLEIYRKDLKVLKENIEDYPELVLEKGYVGIIPRIFTPLKEYYTNLIKPLILESSNIEFSFALSNLEEKIYNKLKELNML
ncbi:MAG: hypothetical protein QXR30_03175 [Candidatus Woesearchaeota archaeon]